MKIWSWNTFSNAVKALAWGSAISWVSTPVYALPNLRSYWHLNCAPNGVTRKLQENSQAKIGAGGGVGDLEAACVQSALESDSFQKRLTAFNESGGKGKQPVLDNRRSNEMIKIAVGKLESNHSVKKTPAVGYALGFALGLQGDDWSVNRLDEAQRASVGLELSGNSFLVLGEIFFDKKTLEKAVDYYKKSLAESSALNKEYARYKLAWVDYIRGVQAKNSGAQRKAIQDIAQLTKRLASASGISKALGAKAKEDVLAMVVELGDLAAAKQILQSVGATELYGTLLERMAYTKMAEGAAKSAYELFGLAIKERPMALSAAELSITQTMIAGQATNIPLVVSNLKGLIKNYVQVKAPWRKKQKEADLKKTDTRIEELFFEYTTAIDRQGRDTKNTTVLAQAEVLYKIFIKYFPKSSKSYDMQFFYGQLLYFMQKHEPAAKALAALVKANPKGKSNKDALEIMVTAAQTAFDADKIKYNLPQPGKGLEELVIPPVKQVYADSLDIFVKSMPQHANAPDMQFAAATVYYDFANYEEGIKRYKSFIKKNPTNSYAQPIVARILEYYKYNEKPEALEKVKREIAEFPTLGSDPALKAALAPKSKSKPKAVAAKDDEETEDEEDEGAVKTVKDEEE